MFIPDTNVISELMRPQPDPALFAWVAAQPRDTLFTTSDGWCAHGDAQHQGF